MAQGQAKSMPPMPGQGAVAHLAKVFVPKLVMGATASGAPPTEKGQEVYSVRFSPDGQLLAASCGDSSIKVFNTMNGKLAYHLNKNQGPEVTPTTAVRFRPTGTGQGTRNILLTANASGEIAAWHVTSGKSLFSVKEEDNQVFALDYSHDASRFATGGNDAVVRIYDESTRKVVSELSSGSGKGESNGHSNRIFSVKWAPSDNANILLSGGWDDQVLVWDDRTGGCVGSIFGPHIAGDAIDVHGSSVLTGSWTPDNPVQLWDLRQGTVLHDVPFPTNYGEPCMIYTCQFSKDHHANRIIAGGSGSNEARIFEHADGAQPSVIGSVKGMMKGVFSCDFHPTNNQVAVASGDGTIRTVEYP